MGKVYCEVCKKRCKGNVLKANDKYFHKDCFRCSECKCSLKTGGFFLKNDKYFCQKDYQKLLTPKCKVCGEILSGDIVSALSYSFHKGCFICNQCKTPFNPGNRVTIWKNEFYCVCCSQSLAKRQSTSGSKSRPTSPLSLKQERHNTNGGIDKIYSLKQPLQQQQQQQQQQQEEHQTHSHRLSFADQSSPVSFGASSGGAENSGRVAHKTNSSILKSSLRQSSTMQHVVSPVPNGRHSDHMDSNCLISKASTALPTESSIQEQITHSSFANSRVLSPQCAHSLHGSSRQALSEYGRFYNLSYASIAEQPVRRSTDMYRRNALHTPANSNTISHLQHFHVPQGNRFPMEPTRIIPAGLSRTSRSLNTGLRDILMAQYASPTATALSTDGGGIDASRHSTLVVESEAASLEARRLASFPSGQPPDATFIPAIERYDWPAPASTAVMNAELMRERRERLRKQGVLPASSEESVEDLSIDTTSVGSHCELDGVSGGIGKAIMLEEERVRRRKARTLHHLIDPVSASRSPDAKVEPPYKTRYATHNFASPSRESQRSSVSPHRLGYSLELVNLGNRTWTATDFSYSSAFNRNSRGTDLRNSVGLRPGYTAGQLSLASAKTSSIHRSHCFSSPRLDVSQINSLATNGKVNERDLAQSQLSPIRTNGARQDGGTANSSRDFDTSLLGSAPSYPSVLSSSPFSVPMKPVEEAPTKEIPYKDLLASLGRPPKGVDRTKLEIYLSDAEFEKVFRLSRMAFYRLPEWKRNDLKRRVDLF